MSNDKQAPQAVPAPIDEQRPTRADLIAALSFYANGEHFILSDETAWDTVSNEPQHWQCDEAGTATVEDGSIARMTLAGQLTAAQIQADDDDEAPQAVPAGGEPPEIDYKELIQYGWTALKIRQGTLACVALARGAEWQRAKTSAAAPPQVRQPLTDAEIEKGREATFSVNNPYCPCDSKTMRKAVRWAERAHGITGAEG